MGSKASKHGGGQAVPSKAAAKGKPGSSGDEEKLPDLPQHTSSGYASDVNHLKPSLVANLAPHHQRTDGVYMAYDTSSSWELGRGGCGCVMLVTKKDTNEKFAMKTVRLASLTCLI